MQKPCSYAGCNELTATGYCEKHIQPKLYAPKDKQVHRLYDRNWRKRRMNHLAESPWCEDCLKVGVWMPATDLHHEIRHRGDRHVFATSPLRSLCHSCHSKRTVIEQREGG
jgi:5-methylcytosine-specific restriction protein A